MCSRPGSQAIQDAADTGVDSGREIGMSKHRVVRSVTVIKAEPGYLIVCAWGDGDKPPYTETYAHETVVAWEIHRKEFYEHPYEEGDPPGKVITEVVAIGICGGRSDDGYVAVKHPDGHYSCTPHGVTFSDEESLLKTWNAWSEREAQGHCGSAGSSGTA
jgi:hypothetical protein